MVQLGRDLAQWSSDGLDCFHLGFMAGYGNYHGNTRSVYRDYSAKNNVNGYAVGLYKTWYKNNNAHSGLYLDGWVQYGWFNNSVKGDYLQNEIFKSKGWLASAEIGYSFKI